MDGSPPDCSVRGILQARILEWVAITFSRGSSRARDQIQVSCLSGRLFTQMNADSQPCKSKMGTVDVLEDAKTFFSLSVLHSLFTLHYSSRAEEGPADVPRKIQGKLRALGCPGKHQSIQPSCQVGGSLGSCVPREPHPHPHEGLVVRVPFPQVAVEACFSLWVRLYVLDPLLKQESLTGT